MFGLSFLYPAFLAGAAAVAVPIVLHLLKREQVPRVLFAAVRFLRRAPVAQTRRKRLRELLLLALRVAALALLAAAFARPYVLAANPAGTRVTVVALDRSYSMAAPGQFARAQTLARETAAAAGRSELVGLVTFDEAAELLVAPTTDRAALDAAIARAAPGFGGTSYRAALTRASEAVESARGRVVVVTDLQRSGWDGSGEGLVAERVDIAIADVGPTRENLAVTGVRREPDGLVALVRNTAGSPRRGVARLLVEGRRVSEAPFNVVAPGSAEVRFRVPLPRAGVAAVAIDDPRGFTADNARYLVLDPPEPPLLLLVTSRGSAANEALYLERALLASADGPSRFRVETSSGEACARFSSDQLAQYGAIFLLGTRGLDRRARGLFAGYVEQGGGLLIAAGPDVDPSVVSELFASAGVKLQSSAPESIAISFVPADPRHPVFRVFGGLSGNLSHARFTQIARVSQAGSVIARFSNGAPGLVEYGAGRGRMLLMASDFNNRWNDLPLQPTYVPFVHELAWHLSAAPDRSQDYVVADVPEGVPPVAGVAWVPVVRGGPTREGGATAPRGRRRVAVNVDVRESDPERLTEAEFGVAVTRLRQATVAEARRDVRREEDSRRLWRWALALVMVTLVAEGVVGRRLA